MLPAKGWRGLGIGRAKKNMQKSAHSDRDYRFFLNGTGTSLYGKRESTLRVKEGADWRAD